MACDAIVNPTNTRLLPTGGTDAVIHRAAGERLFLDCRRIDRIETGEAVITAGYDLPAKYVIHTAGPVWVGGGKGEGALLAACYENALRIAAENGCESIAIPLISSGTYGFPKDRVLSIAIAAIGDFLFTHEMQVSLVVYDREAYALSEKLFGSIQSYIDDRYTEMPMYRSMPQASAPRRYRVPRQTASEPRPMADFAAPCAGAPMSLEDYITLDDGFALKLMRLIDQKGMDDVTCYKRANVSKQTWYKIVNDANYKPNKKTVIAFAIALKLTLKETQTLLESVGFILSSSSLFDVIIMYCIENGIYDVLEIDAALFKYDQETLFSKA